MVFQSKINQTFWSSKRYPFCQKYFSGQIFRPFFLSIRYRQFHRPLQSITNTFWMCGGIIRVFVGSVDGWWLGNSKTELRKSGSPVGRAALEKNQTEIVTVAQEEVWKRRSLPTKDWKTAFPQTDQVHPSSCNRLSLSFSFQQDHQWWRYHRRLLVYQSLYF